MRKRKRIILTLTGLLVLQVAIWFSVYLSVKNVLFLDDSLEIAQTARSILEGRGFSLLSYPLPGLDILHKHGLISGDWPNLQKFPLPPFFLAVLFYIFGYSDEVITLSSVIPYFLILPPFFLFSLKIIKADLLSTSMGGILLIVNPVVVESSLIGQPEPGAIVLFLLSLTFILWKNLNHHYVLAGVTAALAYFNRQESILWISVAVLWIYFMEKRQIKPALQFFLTFLIAASPWLIYVVNKVGTPFFTLQGTLGIPAVTKTYPNYLYAEMSYIDPLRFVLTHPLEMLEKWVKLAWSFWQNLPKNSGIPLALVFFALWFFQKQNKRETRLKVFILGSLIFISFFTFLFYPEIRYFLFVFPILLIFGTKTYLKSIQRLKDRKIIFLFLILFFVLLNSLGLIPMITNLTKTTGYRYVKAEPIFIQGEFRDNDIIISNLPRLIGWYAKKKAATLPKKPSDIVKIEEKYNVNIKGIYLVSPSLHSLLPVWEEGWGEIQREKPRQIGEYKLIKLFPSGSLLYKKIHYN